MSQSIRSGSSVFQSAALKSGLVTLDQLADAVRRAASDDDDAVAAVLVSRGMLTRYQGEQLKAGRSKLNLGPYVITGWIGQGGMGQVFRAVHAVMGRECAVKVLPLEKATEEARDSFLREIRVQAGLDCPYLVRAFDAGRDGSVHYLVTEYVPGTDLRRLVKREGALGMRQAASILWHAAMGLEYAHQQGLIHRDVKPGNLLVAPDGTAKVSDVGLAAWATAMSDDPRAGKIVGTADYLSPEQIRNPMKVTAASDIYSLGCTLYYAICGKVPFPGGDTASKCRRHCEETPWHPRKFNPDLNEDFVDLIADMMEKDPAKRIQSAAEVAERLEVWATEETPVAMQPIDRGPWLAPPPPAHEASLRDAPPPPPPLGDPGTPPVAAVGSDTASHSGWETLPLPPAYGGAPSERRPRPWSFIAALLAVIIPLALLVGAIVGFLVRGMLDQPIGP